MSLPASPATGRVDMAAAEEALGVRPDTAVRLIQLVTDERASAVDLQRVIEMDSGMTTRLLKLANSAMYGMRSKIVKVDRAVAMLGAVTVSRLAMSVSMSKAFQGIQTIEGITPAMVWKYSASVALATEVILARSGLPDNVGTRKLGGEAFVVGMIHEIGTVVLAKLQGPVFAEAVRGSKNGGVPLYKREQAILGTDHATLGRELAERWTLPECLREGIGFHHEPFQADREYQPLASVVYMASQLVRRAGVDCYDGEADPLHFEQSLERLQIEPGYDGVILNEIRDKLSAANDLLASP